MKLKELKHLLFKCELPIGFEKKFSERLGCCAFTPFNFPPFPEVFRTEFWFTFGHKSDITTDTEKFSTAYVKYIQEGFTSPFISENIKVQEFDALKFTFPEVKQLNISEGKNIKYQLETQAIVLFLNDKHVLHIYFSYDITNKDEAAHIVSTCLNSLQILGDKTVWERVIKKEKKVNADFWAEADEEKRLKERNKRVIEDAKLGTLKPNPNPNLKPEENTWWLSEMAFEHYHFKLGINLGINDEEENKVRAITDRILENFEAHEAQAKQTICDEFCTLFNNTWRQDEPKISSEAFKNRIQLETVEIDKNLECRFWYDDDDMFSKHELLVSFYLKENGEWAEIHTEMFG